MILAVAGTTIICVFIGWGKQKFNEFKKKKAQKRVEQAKESYLEAIAEEKAQAESDSANSNKGEV